jgi:hypothetical protein
MKVKSGSDGDIGVMSFDDSAYLWEKRKESAIQEGKRRKELSLASLRRSSLFFIF